jgi:hypothetical protein
MKACLGRSWGQACPTTSPSWPGPDPTRTSPPCSRREAPPRHRFRLPAAASPPPLAAIASGGERPPQRRQPPQLGRAPRRAGGGRAPVPRPGAGGRGRAQWGGGTVRWRGYRAPGLPNNEPWGRSRSRSRSRGQIPEPGAGPGAEGRSRSRGAGVLGKAPETVLPPGQCGWR